LSPRSSGAIFITFALIKNAFVVVHYIECSVDTRHALELDGAVKKPGPVEAAAEHGPVKPVLSVC
jgi:hypothetical protein